jgi:endonuclease-3 related protein
MLQMGLVDEKISYLGMKKLFESILSEDVAIYQEYHALIVEHAKRYYSKKPYAVNDPLLELFK